MIGGMSSNGNSFNGYTPLKPTLALVASYSYIFMQCTFPTTLNKCMYEQYN